MAFYVALTLRQRAVLEVLSVTITNTMVFSDATPCSLVLDAFAKLRRATTSFVLAVPLHRTNRPPLNRF